MHRCAVKPRVSPEAIHAHRDAHRDTGPDLVTWPSRIRPAELDDVRKHCENCIKAQYRIRRAPATVRRHQTPADPDGRKPGRPEECAKKEAPETCWNSRAQTRTAVITARPTQGGKVGELGALRRILWVGRRGGRETHFAAAHRGPGASLGGCAYRSIRWINASTRVPSRRSLGRQGAGRFNRPSLGLRGRIDHCSAHGC